jgi:hypothetical protein
MITLPAILDGYSHRKDNSYTLRFVSGLEISKKEREAIDDAFQQEGWLIFSQNQSEVVVPTIKASTGRKSPMQILSARMFVCWRKQADDGKTTKDFETWYKNQLEVIGNQYLEKMQ